MNISPTSCLNFGAGTKHTFFLLDVNHRCAKVLRDLLVSEEGISTPFYLFKRSSGNHSANPGIQAALILIT